MATPWEGRHMVDIGYHASQEQHGCDSQLLPALWGAL